MNNLNTTIVALATPPIKSAIHLIRMSGNNCYEIVNKLTHKKISQTPNYFQLVNLYDGDQYIDQVILLTYVKPNSYTGEDMIEISCHGSTFISHWIIDTLVKNGASYADKGEFTKRAVINNKINLLQAKGVNDIINANSLSALQIAQKITNTNTTKHIQKLAKQIFNLIGQIEVSIDYPEYDESINLTNQKIINLINDINNKLNYIINESKKAIPLTNGINVAIVGLPNVGKSSLLNAILNQNRAIVSSIPGTTRDLLQYSVNINDITFNLIDTAGIHQPNDKIEKIGIDQTKQTIKNADLVLFVIDGSKKYDQENNKILKLLRKKKYLTIINKSDLKHHNIPITGLWISAKQKKINSIFDLIIKQISHLDLNTDIIFNSASDINQIIKVKNLLNTCLISLNQNKSTDLIVNYLHEAHQILLNLIGRDLNFDFFEELFKNFCIGK